ncbi:MAG TPA: histidinol-phosphate transaminase [Gemmatimonadaceae bacterium]|nr:histidinol-phosphate transaminase [Gemmatimonadaceae bacterium]
MPVSRRSFVRMLGGGGVGAFAVPALSFVSGRGQEALAADGWRGQAGLPPAPDLLRLDSNENPRGPFPSVMQAIRDALGGAARYPYQVSTDLRAAIAAAHRVAPENVLIGCGSGESLRVAVDTWCSATRSLVTAAPTYEGPVNRAVAMGIPVRAVRVGADLALDLDAMAAAAPGAGVVFLCNPNNPTGTVHGTAAVRAFVDQVARTSEAVVVVDEAYHEYCVHPDYASALPLALATPRVVVIRTFSKAYGLAGLRVGYAIGHRDAIAAMQKHRLANGVNQLGGAAAIAALRADAAELARERALNAEGLAIATRFFRDAGFAVAPSHANFVYVDVHRDVRRVQEAARARGVLVGRPFPPLASHLRVSIGTADELRAALPIIGQVLTATT